MPTHQQRQPAVDAVQWTGDITVMRQSFSNAQLSPDGETCLVPSQLGGSVVVKPNSWVTLDMFGNINVVPDEHFALLYEPI